MTLTVFEALGLVKRLDYEIESVLKQLGEELDNVGQSYNEDENFIRTELQKIYNHLENAHDSLNYLKKPVVEEGRVYLNSDKRLELPSGHYFTSGSVCEIYGKIYETDEPNWFYTSIEHGENGYYATIFGQNVNIEGYLVRYRSRSRY